MENDDIILLISDDGVGISPEKLGTILSEREPAVQEEPISRSIILTDVCRSYTEQNTDLPIPAGRTGHRGTDRIPAQKEYRSPYSSGSEGYGSRMAPALSMVSATAGERRRRSVTPEKLLRYGQKITHNLYKIEICTGPSGASEGRLPLYSFPSGHRRFSRTYPQSF